MTTATRWVCALVAATLALAGAGAAGAATFTVTKTTDSADGVCDADCSLREAIGTANATIALDEIVLPAGVTHLSLATGVAVGEDLNATGDVDIAADVVLRGAGAALTSIVQETPDRVIDVTAMDADVAIRDLTVAGGRTPIDQAGGGIRHVGQAALTLERVVLRDNVAWGSLTGYGGGVYKTLGQLTITDSAIIANSAIGGGFGAGVFVSGLNMTVSMTNVTIAGNRANQGGGGIYSNSQLAATLVNVTVTRNDGANGVGGIGGDAAGFRLRSSIVSGNTRTTPGNAECQSGFAPTSDGGNVGSAQCGLGAADVLTADAGLEPLSAASVIPVAVPAVGSPALDRAVGACPATDARALPRPQGAACDAGAAERPVAVPVVAAPEACTIRGTDGADVLRGTNRADVICAFGANDVIRALRGDDIVLAGSGADRVFAAQGADVVFGGSGNDTIDAGTGSDTVFGGGGNDLLLARDRAFDLVDGGAGRDRARLDARADRRRGVERLIR